MPNLSVICDLIRFAPDSTRLPVVFSVMFIRHVHFTRPSRTQPSKLNFRLSQEMNKHGHSIVKFLVTGSKGNSEVCFPENFNVPRGEAERNIEVEGKQNSLFLARPVIKCFVIPSNSKLEKNCEEIVCLTLQVAGSPICRGFKEHNLITCESKIHVVVSLAGEFLRFDPRHVALCPPIGKRI